MSNHYVVCIFCFSLLFGPAATTDVTLANPFLFQESEIPEEDLEIEKPFHDRILDLNGEVNSGDSGEITGIRFMSNQPDEADLIKLIESLDQLQYR